jgi:hypothetical protein
VLSERPSDQRPIQCGPRTWHPGVRHGVGAGALLRCQNADVGKNSPDRPTPGDVPDEQVWGNNLFSRIFLSLPVLCATLWTLIDSENWPIREMWPGLLALGILSVMAMRPTVRTTKDELVIRYPIGGRRLARADVVSARFNYFGLRIRLRAGGSAFAFLSPKMTSTELSSGARPEPGSAAYEITRWAQAADPSRAPVVIPKSPEQPTSTPDH